MSPRTPEAKQRRREKRLQKQAEYAAAKAVMRATGARCATCENYIKSPVGRACELDSDFYGYALVDADDVCPRWSSKSNSND